MPNSLPRSVVVIAALLGACLVLHSATGSQAADAAAAKDWPQFRGPTGQGVSTATGVPVEWGPDKNVAWKTPIGGKGWSSPVLSGGRLYLTTAVGDPGAGMSLRAVCVDAAAGKVLWDVEVFKPDPAAAGTMHGKNSPASPTPIVWGDWLYVHFGHMGTAALDAESGKVRWRQTELKYPPLHGNGGSPALVGDGDTGGLTLIFSCDGLQDPFVAGLDAKTGRVKWKTPRNSGAKRTFSFSTPLAINAGDRVHEKVQVIIPGSGMVAAYDPADGREIWRVKYDEGYSVVPRPVYAPDLGLVFMSTAFDTPVVYAIRPAGAKGDVTDTHVAWTHRKGGPATPSPLLVGDELYFVSDNGIATCADAKTGKPHWTERLDGGFSASPVAAEGRVYFQNEGGVGYVVKAGKQFELIAENDLGERSLASYAVTDGALFIRTEGHLWKIADQSRAAAK